jgi:hypothetical protein
MMIESLRLSTIDRLENRAEQVHDQTQDQRQQEHGRQRGIDACAPPLVADVSRQSPEPLEPTAGKYQVPDDRKKDECEEDEYAAGDKHESPLDSMNVLIASGLARSLIMPVFGTKDD